jgi:hypothetical protein
MGAVTSATLAVKLMAGRNSVSKASSAGDAAADLCRPAVAGWTAMQASRVRAVNPARRDVRSL